MSTAFPSRRPEASSRKFTSAAVERALAEVSGAIADPELAWLFNNCLPNTLDTTVTLATDAQRRPDTFVITGDIAAMWLRDSTHQVWPYLRFARDDRALRDLLRGVIHRQAACVRLDPYANAFYADPVFGEWRGDDTVMLPGVHERKFELDSLCAVLRLAAGYWRQTGDLAPFDADWREAVRLILATLRTEQAGGEEAPGSPYYFRRTSPHPSETLAASGLGAPARRCGLVRSAFRPSDDATTFPFLVPANAMAVVALREAAPLLDTVRAPELAREALGLAAEIAAALEEQAVVNLPGHGEIWAYEVDGYGSRLLMDDANLPSLLALPLLGFCPRDEARYRRTRAFVLSAANPYFSSGAAGAGIGGPHVGRGWIWPMAIVVQALTAIDDAEIVGCLRTLRATHAGTGFMHESFWKNDASRYTRGWFAWANSLFGELILTLHAERPHLLKTAF